MFLWSPGSGIFGSYCIYEGVKVDPRKIKSIKEWKIPTSINHLRGFLGLTGYYRKFVKNYGRIAAPLTQNED